MLYRVIVLIMLLAPLACSEIFFLRFLSFVIFHIVICCPLLAIHISRGRKHTYNDGLFITVFVIECGYWM
jgi:hypothetical protein